MNVLWVMRSALFYVAFYGGSVLYVLAAATARPFSSEWLLRICQGWSRFHRHCARTLLGIRVKVEGELPRGTVLVALRHESFFEAIDLPALLDRPAVFAKAELLRIPFWGPLGEAYGLIGVDRNKGARALRGMLAAARSHQEGDRLLAIFPEGTRVRHGETAPVQSGFSGLYKLLGCPVVPVSVDSGPLYHRWIKRPGTVTYRVGETIPTGLPREEVEARVARAISGS
jgi:1-acyl-sn-glycerol-3-phosphate acyltransferase